MKDLDKLILEVGLSRSVIENYITFADKHYNTYYIPKKSGGKRAIDCPGANLKAIQRWILKNHLNKLEVNKRASGFVEKRGIKRNAMFHLNKRYLLTIDIKNFFPSISQKQVFETLDEQLSDRDFAIKIAKICTFKRYADDMTFSSDNKHSLQLAYKLVNELLYKNGFNINKKKTRYLSGKGNVSVTGVNINKGVPKVKSKVKKQIRAELHHYIIKEEKINLKKLAGYISCVSSIEDDYKEKIKTYIENLKSKKH